MLRVWDSIVKRKGAALAVLATALVIAAMSTLLLTHHQPAKPTTSQAADDGIVTPTSSIATTYATDTVTVTVQTGAAVPSPSMGTPPTSTPAPPPTPAATPTPAEPNLRLWQVNSKQMNIVECPTTVSAQFWVMIGPSTPPPPITVTYHWLRLEDGSPANVPASDLSGPAGDITVTIQGFSEGSSFSEVWDHLPTSQFAGHRLTSQVVVTAISGQQLSNPEVSAPVTLPCPSTALPINDTSGPPQIRCGQLTYGGLGRFSVPESSP
jgi:hypothetical protein